MSLFLGRLDGFGFYKFTHNTQILISKLVVCCLWSWSLVMVMFTFFFKYFCFESIVTLPVSFLP